MEDSVIAKPFNPASADHPARASYAEASRPRIQPGPMMSGSQKASGPDTGHRPVHSNILEALSQAQPVRPRIGQIYGVEQAKELVSLDRGRN